MKNIMITGASGFVGKQLCKLFLDAGEYVHAVVRSKEKMKDFLTYDNLKVIECNMDEFSNLIDMISVEIDVLYHLAWDGTYGSALKDYNRQITNIKNTCDLVHASSQFGCNHFVFAGTINELEIKSYYGLEVFEPRLACVYGNSKLATEMYCKILTKQYGIRYNTAIISSVYGPGDYSQMIQNVIIGKMLDGESPQLVSGDNLYDWLYIDDAVEMLYKISETNNNFKTYYIGNSELRTFKEIISEVRDIVNPKLNLQFGVLKDTAFIDYSLIDTNSIFEDTDMVIRTNFRESIIKTVEWINNEFRGDV